MIRLREIFVAILCAILSASTGALADTEQSPSATAKPRPNKSALSHLMSLPVSLAGVCAGVAVGTPICYVRKLHQEVRESSHGLAGSIVNDENHKFLLIPAGLVWLPVSLVITTLEAPGYALKDAWMADKPFSKEQFSLGEIDAPQKQ